MNVFSLIFLWLLPLTAGQAVTSGQNHNLTDGTNQSPHNTTQATKAEQTTRPSATPSLQTTPTAPSKTIPPNIQAATPTNSQLSPSKSPTVGKMSTVSATTVVTSPASNLPTTTRLPSMISSSTQSQDAGQTSTSQFTSNETTNSSTTPTESTSLISTSTESTSKGRVTGGETTQAAGFYKTSKAATKRPFIQTTTAQKRPGSLKTGSNDSKVVAGIIGSALVLMLVGFLVIYMKKRKLQNQQISTRDWAGPSPFLEGGADNGEVTLRSSNRISLSSFLPQRLSKRLSLLPETDEELEDMTHGSTFGDKHQTSTFGKEVDGNDVKESNGTAGVKAERKSTGDPPEKVENSEPSSQTNDPLSTNNNSEDPKLSQDPPAGETTQPGAVENAPEQLNNGLAQP
uniref:protein EVI2B-like n=1 Tax=Semicossyphus pulcher TaxID=241346 RepID=UPI0037E9C064